MRTCVIILLTLLYPVSGQGAPSSEGPLPIRLFVDNIRGSYEGTVVDGGQPVAQVLTFTRSPTGLLSGRYIVRQEAARYEGTFTNPIVTGPMTLTFTWQDHHGQGIVTLTFSAKGDRFDGNWGDDQVRPDLTINGQRHEN